jgi:PAS domain-containing protein
MIISLRPYLVATLAVVLSVLVFALIMPAPAHTPMSLFVAVVVFSAWYGGVGPALLSAFLGTLARYYLLFERVGYASLAEDAIYLGILLFAAVLAGRLFARRDRAERVLSEQREWLQVILASIGDAVIAADREARVRFLNPAAEALTGWTSQEVVGQPLAYVLKLTAGLFRISHGDPKMLWSSARGGMSRNRGTSLAEGPAMSTLIPYPLDLPDVEVWKTACSAAGHRVITGREYPGGHALAALRAGDSRAPRPRPPAAVAPSVGAGACG